MKNILIDARMYGLEYTGIGRYLINLVDNLKISNEFHFTILLKDPYFKELSLPNDWTKVSANIGHYTVKEQIALTNIIIKNNPDLVHFPHFNVPLSFKKPFVVTIHDMTMHSQGLRATNLPLINYLFKKVPYKIIFKYAVTQSKQIIVPCNFVKEELVKYYKNINSEKINVIHEGYREILREKQSSNELEILNKFKLLNKNYFFYVGNAYPHKNLEKVIKSIEEIKKNSNTDYLFVIAGKNDKFVERIGEYIKKSNLENNIFLIGFVTDSELAVLYKHSLAFIYPSLSEGFGLQGLEAMASQALLIASDIPVFREIFKDNAIYFNPSDINSCCQVIKQVAHMDVKQKNLSILKAKEFVSKYSWKTMTEETIKVYENCLSI